MHLQDTTSNTVIGKIKSVYARWGIPFVLVTDNGPQFRSEQFKQFCENYGFTHITSGLAMKKQSLEMNRVKQIMLTIMTGNIQPVLYLHSTLVKLVNGVNRHK